MSNVDLNKKADKFRSLDKKICVLLSESSLKKEWLRPEEDPCMAGLIENINRWIYTESKGAFF